jgi:hypothetical protein
MAGDGVLGHRAGLQGPHATWLDLGALHAGRRRLRRCDGGHDGGIVCLLGVLVLFFNRWYMHDDPQAARFPWQFCGFVFAMLGVVLSDNLFLSFCCWELVGLGSYLLIGFWFESRPRAKIPSTRPTRVAGRAACSKRA